MTVSRARADRIERKKGHVADDPTCTYWAGDFAGVRLHATCPVCNDLSPETFEFDLERDQRWYAAWLLIGLGLAILLAVLLMWAVAGV